MNGVVNSVAYAGGHRVGEVQHEFGLHDLAIEDAARAHQRPKLERYGESLFAVLRTAHLDRESGALDFGETHLFVGPAYVVSVRHGPSLPYVEVRSRCEASPLLLARGPGYGMNFKFMPELEWSLGYPLVMGIMRRLRGFSTTASSVPAGSERHQRRDRRRFSSMTVARQSRDAIE